MAVKKFIHPAIQLRDEQMEKVFDEILEGEELVWFPDTALFILNNGNGRK
jgi:hypothetical protein